MKAEKDVSRTTLGTVPGTVQEVILGGSPKPVFPRISAPIPGAKRTATLGPNRGGTGRKTVGPTPTCICLLSLKASLAVICWATRASVCRVVCRATSKASYEGSFKARCGTSFVGENRGQCACVGRGYATLEMNGAGQSQFSVAWLPTRSASRSLFSELCSSGR
jgi:hypothetical protein